MITKLKQSGIGTSVHWMPLHMHPYYQHTYGYVPQDLPVAASLYREIITLPLYPEMSEEQVGYVCATLKDLIHRHLKVSPA